MTRTISILALAAALASSTPVLAQDQAAGAESEPAAEGTTTEGAAAAETPAAGPAVGQTYLAQTFTDWDMRCLKAESGQDPCQLFQALNDEKGTAVAEISLFAMPPGQEVVAGAEVITPLETLLTPGLRLSVDGGQGRRYPFNYCAQYAPERYGCFARLGFTAEEIAQFKRGKVATIEIAPAVAPDEVVALKISLSGFTAGWDAVSATAPKE